MKIAAIIQARMTSTRLPGKVLKTILNKPLLEYQIERVRSSKLINEIIIATTTNQTDEPIVKLCEQLKVTYFRGPEDDVLTRYYQAAKNHHVDIIVRLTSDCPIIDAKEIDKVIDYFLQQKDDYDYVANTMIRTYPRGMDTEVFSFETLEKTFIEAKKEFEREHVTPYIYNNKKEFRLANIPYSQDLSNYRWTVDTKEDFELISKIISYLYPKNNQFSLEDVLAVLNKFPNWSKINQHIEQKKLGE